MTHHPLEDQIIPSPCPSSSSMSGSSDGSSKKASTQRFWWQMSFNVLQIQPWPVSIIVSCFSYLSRAHHTHPTKLYSSFFRSFLGEPISAIHCNLAYSVFAEGCLHRNQGCYYHNRINWIQDIQDIQKYNLMKKIGNHQTRSNCITPPHHYHFPPLDSVPRWFLANSCWHSDRVQWVASHGGKHHHPGVF